MKTGKSERDLLLDQTLALVKAAIDHDAVSSSAARARLNPMLSNELAAEKIARTERDPLVEDILSLIEHVSHEAHKANGTAWEAALPMTSATYFLNTVSRDYLACKLRRSVSSSIQSLFFQAPTRQ